jgi:hypothetical protein
MGDLAHRFKLQFEFTRDDSLQVWRSSKKIEGLSFMSPIPASQLASKPHVEVAAAIIFHDGHILISQRDEKSHLSGYWEFLAKREPDESFGNAYARDPRAECRHRSRRFRNGPVRVLEKIVQLNFYFAVTCVCELRWVAASVNGFLSENWEATRFLLPTSRFLKSCCTPELIF